MTGRRKPIGNFLCYPAKCCADATLGRERLNEDGDDEAWDEIYAEAVENLKYEQAERDEECRAERHRMEAEE